MPLTSNVCWICFFPQHHKGGGFVVIISREEYLYSNDGDVLILQQQPTC